MANGNKQLPARRPVKETATYKELKDKFDRQGKSLTTTRAELKARTVPALAEFAAGQGGAAIVGLSKGASGNPEPMGVPLEIWLGLPTVILGAVFGSPKAIALAGGMIAPFTADYFEDMGKDLFETPAEETPT